MVSVAYTCTFQSNHGVKVYERGIASITNSVDLWKDYCGFKAETCHDSDVTRE